MMNIAWKVNPVKGEYNDEEMKRYLSLYSRMTYSSFIISFDKWHPFTDIYETDDEFIIICDIAGVEPDKIQVLLEKNTVQIKGERNNNYPKGSAILHDVEILCGQFERVIHIPENIEISEAKASYKNGFLKILLKKGKRSVETKKEVPIE